MNTTHMSIKQAIKGLVTPVSKYNNNKKKIMIVSKIPHSNRRDRLLHQIQQMSSLSGSVSKIHK